jgi:UDP-glucose 4-epimerase
MRIIVTGGAGFIGSNIVDKLIKLNFEVAIIDNLSTGKKEFINPKAKFYELDIFDSKLESIFNDIKPELVIHHAAQIDVQSSLNNPIFDAQTNILGTINILEQCKKNNVQKILYASSAAVYGSPNYLGVDELHNIDPSSFYGISKHTPEHYIKTYSQLCNLDYTILRYANVYGIRQDPKGEGGVISIFLDKLLNNQNVMIYGNGEQTRDFIFINDIVNANICALTKGSRSIFNISTNTQTSINELFNIMTKISNRYAIPNYADQKPGDIMHSRLNNELAKKLLGWSPEYSLFEGLNETYKYYLNKFS